MQNHARKNGVKVSFCGDLFDANLSCLRSKFSQQNQILVSNLRQFQAGRINFTAKSKLISHKVQLQPKQNQHKFRVNRYRKAKQISNFQSKNPRWV